MRKFFISLFVVLFLVAGIFFYHRVTGVVQNVFGRDDATTRSILSIDSIPVSVDIADTPALRAQGLSGRERLAENEGMLFIFEKEGIPGFWMKDMNFAIDIIWISVRGEVVDIHERVSPDTYPLSFRPKVPIKYVLEVPAGFTDANNVKIGSRVEAEML